MDSTVTQCESSDAKSTATGAMSSGSPNAERSAGDDLRSQFTGEIPVGRWRVRMAAQYGVDPDAARTEFACQCEDQRIDSALRRRINAGREVGVDAEDGTDIDDAARLAEQLECFTNGKQVSQHVEIELLVERIGGEVVDHLKHRLAGVGMSLIERSEHVLECESTLLLGCE